MRGYRTSAWILALATVVMAEAAGASSRVRSIVPAPSFSFGASSIEIAFDVEGSAAQLAVDYDVTSATAGVLASGVGTIVDRDQAGAIPFHVLVPLSAPLPEDVRIHVSATPVGVSEAPLEATFRADDPAPAFPSRAIQVRAQPSGRSITVDVRYFGQVAAAEVSLLGSSAEALRMAGGNVEQAGAGAFAIARRLVGRPGGDPGRISFVVPLLDDADLAPDGLVIADVALRDPFGRTVHSSAIEFTSGTAFDPLLGLSVRPSPLLLSDGFGARTRDDTGVRSVDPSVLGQPQTAVLTGAGRSITRRLSYDDLGRLVRMREEETGREQAWSYDSLGRTLRVFVGGSPSQEWTYTYETIGDGVLAVEERLAGTAHRRLQTFEEGNLVEERFTFGDPANPSFAAQNWTYEGGRLTDHLDAAGVRHEYTYDARGRLAHVQSGDFVQSFVRDAAGKVTKITDAEGFETRLRYDQFGRPVEWIWPESGAAESYESVVLDVAGNVIQRAFGKRGVNPPQTPHRFENVVDALGRALSQTSRDGQINVASTFDVQGRPTSITDSVSGLSERREYHDLLGRPTRIERDVQTPEGTLHYVRALSYADTPTGLTTITILENVESAPNTPGWARSITQEVDATGRLLKEISTIPGQQQNRVVSYSYDPRGHLIQRSDTSGTEWWSYDAAGRLWSHTDADNGVTQIKTDAAGRIVEERGPHPESVWTTQFDDLGRPISLSLAGQASWTWSYGPEAGRVVENGPEGEITDRVFNARRQLLSETRWGPRSSQVRTLTYDGPWLSSEVVEEGGWRSERTRAAIDDRGRTRDEIERWRPKAGPWEYEYRTTTSWSGRRADVEETSQGGATHRVVTLDSLGNVVLAATGGLTDQWRFDAAGQLAWEQPAGQAKTLYAYAEGLRTKATLEGSDGALETTSYEYFSDGRIKSVLDPSGRMRSYAWTPRGLLASVAYGDGISVDRTDYTYDPAGVVEMWKGGDQGAKWLFEHGPRGELRRVVQPGGVGEFVYQYDRALHLTGISLPSGSAMPDSSFGYDSLGRLTSRRRGTSTWTSLTSEGLTKTTTPTGDVEITLVDGRGRLAERTRQAGSGSIVDLISATYTYGIHDEPFSVAEQRVSGNVLTLYSYDGRSRLRLETRAGTPVFYTYAPDSDLLATVTSPGGTTTRTYDGFGRLKTLSGAVTTTLTWEAGGARLLGASGGGLYETRCYDGAARLASVTNDSSAAACELAPSYPLARFEYAYDARGNRQSESYTGAKFYPSWETTEYGYDAADRLTGVRYGLGGTSLYQLDGSGTRRAEKHLQGYAGSLEPAAFASATAPGMVHQVHRFDASGGLAGTNLDGSPPSSFANYTTDASGRLVYSSRGGVENHFGWDGQQLASAQVSDGAVSASVSYLYDHAGRRVSRTRSGATTNFVWAGGTLAEEQPQPGSSFVFQQAEGLTFAAGSDRLLHDALGSVAGWKGITTTLHRHDAWGAYRTHPIDPTAWELPTASGPSYAGQHWDPDVRLSYADQRWYAPELGRFLSEDPFSGYADQPVTLHPFVYANANPSRYIDPTGRAGMSIGRDDALLAFESDVVKRCGAGDGVSCGVVKAGFVVMGLGASPVVPLAAGALPAEALVVAGTAAKTTMVAWGVLSLITLRHDEAGGTVLADPASLIVGETARAVASCVSLTDEPEVVQALRCAEVGFFAGAPAQRGAAKLRSLAKEAWASRPWLGMRTNPIASGGALEARSGSLLDAVEGALDVATDRIAAGGGQKLLTPGRYAPKGFASGQLEKHFAKHAGEWGSGNITQAGYLKRANSLLGQDVGGDILGAVRSNGDVLRYNLRTNEFAVGAADGTIRTLFRPQGGMAYWLELVGK